MNRREALAALVALPQITRVSVAQVKSRDVIVAECDGLLTERYREEIRQQLSSVWPDNKIVVCSKDVRLKVMSSDGE